MRIVRNRLIPFGDFAAINLFGILFTKPGVKISPELIRHESIHTVQIKELLFIPFYIIYLFEWVWKLIKYKGDTYKAYRKISFEQEAYSHQHDKHYLRQRKRFAQWRVRNNV